MRKTTTKQVSLWAAVALAFTMLPTALALSTGGETTHAYADGEQGKLLYIVDCGRINDQNGNKLSYGYDSATQTPTPVNKATTFLTRNGGRCLESEDSNLTLLQNSYTDKPFGVDSRSGKSWGYTTINTTDLPHRVGRAGGYNAGYSEFRSVNDATTTSERLVYKFEVDDNRALDVTVMTCSPTPATGADANNITSGWGTVEGKMSVNGGTPFALVSKEGNDNREDHSIPGCSGVLDTDNKYYLTLTFGEEGAHTVVNGIIIREKPYSITYELDGGSNNNANKESYTQGNGFTLADPTRDGYAFKGWYDAQTGGNKVTEISNMQTGDITLYARWEAITYTITYELDGGTNNAANKETYTYGNGFTLADPTRDGYTFKGWYDAQTGGNKVTVISVIRTGNVTLYARWTKIPEEGGQTTPPRKPMSPRKKPKRKAVANRASAERRRCSVESRRSLWARLYSNAKIKTDNPKQKRTPVFRSAFLYCRKINSCAKGYGAPRARRLRTRAKANASRRCRRR